jgi:hypothetical protein
LILANYGGHRPLPESLFNKVVAIETLALNGEEEVSRLNMTRVDGIRLRDCLRVERAFSVQELRNP